ncbi:MAG: glycosyltransferase family 4 protein [Clostridia bacterium]|nr:glycosyltransferase family 4 protein [Clostridia bacterium]MBQ2731138.1 glycosyltransferase family 4 protein [Clostridia bacterium]
MKKVLIIANNAGGFLLFRQETLIGLLEEGYDVTVALPDEPQVAQVEALGAEVEIVPVSRRSTNPFSDLLLFLRYRRLIRRLRPDVVLTYTVKCNIYGGMACRVTGTPYVSTITGLGSGLGGSGLLQKIIVVLSRMGLRRCRTLFCQNTFVERFVREQKLFDGNLCLLPGSGVNLEEHPYTPYPDEADGIRICFLGRLMRDKGIGELLSAAETLHEKGANVVFHLAGMVEEEAWMDRVSTLEERGAIVYHGSLLDVRPLIRDCHASVMPSYQEGMCNALMESAAMGRALLASDVPGCRETVGEKNGFLFASHSADGIVEAVERFLALTKEEREEMGRASNEKMIAEFDRRLVTQRVLEAVRSIN